MNKNPSVSRRQFLKASVIGGAAAFAAPTIVPSSIFGKNAPSNIIQVGQIGQYER